MCLLNTEKCAVSSFIRFDTDVVLMCEVVVAAADDNHDENEAIDESVSHDVD